MYGEGAEPFPSERKYGEGICVIPDAADIRERGGGLLPPRLPFGKQDIRSYADRRLNFRKNEKNPENLLLIPLGHMLYCSRKECLGGTMRT